jgi:hypothetical protein
MTRELAGLAGRQASVLGGARGTTVQPKQLSAAHCRLGGHHQDRAGDPGPLNLTCPDIALRSRRHHLRPGRPALVTGIAERDGDAKTFTASASRGKP